jgi:hypothetical protein
VCVKSRQVGRPIGCYPIFFTADSAGLSAVSMDKNTDGWNKVITFIYCCFLGCMQDTSCLGNCVGRVSFL